MCERARAQKMKEEEDVYSRIRNNHALVGENNFWVSSFYCSLIVQALNGQKILLAFFPSISLNLLCMREETGVLVKG